MRRINVILLILVALQGCAINKVYYPYTYDHELHQSLADTAIIVAPIGLLGSEYPHRFLDAQIESEIIRYLQQAGHNVVAPAEFAPLWKSCALEQGGLYNSRTGAMDVNRLNHCFGKVIDELNKTHTIKSIVLSGILYEKLSLKSPYERGVWDGVVRKVKVEGQGYGRWQAALVMSLKMQVIHIDGKTILDNQGGIDFIHKTKSKITETAAIPKQADEFSVEHIREAIEVAFHPFVVSERLQSEIVKKQ